MSFQIIKSPNPIHTFIINLIRRPNRRENIIKEFANRSEFNISIVDGIEDPFDKLGPWRTLCLIITEASINKSEFILVCEDDHQFTNQYSEQNLRESIEKARLQGCDILLGGANWIEDSIEVDKALFWTKNFWGSQFTIIFNKFFDTVLNTNLEKYNAADHHISGLSKNIFLVHPFISSQRIYPCSNATPPSNEKGKIKQLFQNSEGNLRRLRNVSQYFGKIKNRVIAIEPFDVSEIMIPTYIINLRKRTDRKSHILEEFKSKNEFQINVCDGITHRNGQVGLWKSIRSVIKLAISKNEDIIVICEDDHKFLHQYKKEFLIENIIKAHAMGADILLGGICNYQSTVKVTDNLFWVDEFYCTQFVVVYKSFFQSILNADYSEPMSVDGKFSSIAINKLVLYPFISIQKDFGYSDITIRKSSQIRPPSPFYNTLARFTELSNKHNQLNNVNRNQ